MTSKETYHFVNFTICTGTIQSYFGRDFVPDLPVYEWPSYRVLGPDKNKCIDEIIAKLNSLRVIDNDNKE